jgi:four helix bundle protein
MAGRQVLPVLPFERFEAWQRCHELSLAVYRVTSSWPPAERYGLTSQVRRAAVSAEANLAEGAAKRGRAEFRRYLDISLGSLSEVACLLRLATDLGILKEPLSIELNAIREHASKLTWLLYRSVARST